MRRPKKTFRIDHKDIHLHSFVVKEYCAEEGKRSIVVIFQDSSGAKFKRTLYGPDAFHLRLSLGRQSKEHEAYFRGKESPPDEGPVQGELSLKV